MSGPQNAHSMVRRLVETSDLSWMDDSTDQGRLQVLRTVQAGICEKNFHGPKAKQESSRGGGRGLGRGGNLGTWTPGVDQAQDYLG